MLTKLHLIGKKLDKKRVYSIEELKKACNKMTKQFCKNISQT